MDDPLRILHVVHSLEPGGMEHVLTTVAGRLAPRGFDVHVCCLEGAGQLADRLPEDHVHPIHRAPGLKLATARSIGRVIRTVRPHLVHTHNFAPLLYTVPATRWGRAVPILHGEHAQLKPSQRHGARRLLRRFLYAACRRIHTVSSSQCDELLALFPGVGSKLVAVVNGVDAQRFSPGDKQAARAGLGLPTDLTLVGIIGRFRATKRHTALIEAMASLPANVGLVVIGEGPERPAIDAAVAASPARDRIFLIGHQEDPLPAIRSLDLLAIPSVSEGLSNALLEAMACAVPAIANNACGNSEAIEHGRNGWVVPMPDSSAIAAGIAACAADPEELARFGRAARQRMLDEFEFANTVTRYESVYRELIGRP